jgi:hypothetical protein
MTSTHVAPNVCHDSIVRRLRDAERVSPKHGAHLPPSAASPLVDPLPEPSEFFASNETGFPARFEALSQHLLQLAHPPGASANVVGVHLAVMDPHLCNIHVLIST